MKILWFTNIPLPDGYRAAGMQPQVKGGWMSSLADALTETGAITLAVASVLPGISQAKHSINGVTHYLMSAKNADEILWNPSSEIISACRYIIAEFKPDIVHIHGTEQFYGLLSLEHMINVPTVISIQGLIHDYYNYYFGGLSLVELWRAHTLYEMLRGTGIIHQRLYWRHQAAMEKRIIAGNRFFIGRTLWDRAHIRSLNEDARYYHCDELMRPVFYERRREIADIDRHTIFIPTGYYPLKGLHVAIKAAGILKKEFPHLIIRVPDASFFIPGRGLKGYCRQSGYSRYLRRLIVELGLEENIQPLGILNGRGMADQLAHAHLVVIPSFVENGSNALQEAMLIGTPTVVSFAGGMPSMVKDGKSALFFPPGDEAILAECIGMLFKDDGLALKIANSAYDIALERNSKESIVKKMIEIYQDVYSSQENV